MDPIRVCFVVNAVGETSVPADIATGIAKYTEIDVDILAWWEATSFHDEERVTVTELNAPNTTLGIDRRIYASCRERLSSYDVIQAHHCHSGSFAKAIAKRVGIPSVSREGNMRRGFTRAGRIANGLTNPLSARIVCNSPAVYASFRRWERALLDKSTVEIIPNGVELSRIDRHAADHSPIRQAAIDDGMVVGTAGMLTEQKDHETLIRAVAAASTRLDTNLILVIAGDGDRRSDLEAMADSLDIRDSINFLGLLERNEVYAMLHEIDVYAMPSKWEGFSAAAVEALGSGTPCIFSDISAFTLPFRDVASFHEVGDSHELADRLVTLSRHPDRREKLGKAGRRLVAENYVIEEVSRGYADLYREVVEQSE